MTKQDIIDYVMNSPENTNKAVLSSMLDSMGGGGSSDFSIAEVTIINGSSSTVNLGSTAGYGCPAIFDYSPNTWIDGKIFYNLSAGDSTIIKVPLYKGCCKWNGITYGSEPRGVFPSGYNCGDITGSISRDSETGQITITGDGSITIVA